MINDFRLALVISSVFSTHDKEIFDEPEGWREKTITESPLIIGFDTLWEQIKLTYKTELSAFAFTAIPEETEVAITFKELIKLIQ